MAYKYAFFSPKTIESEDTYSGKSSTNETYIITPAENPSELDKKV